MLRFQKNIETLEKFKIQYFICLNIARHFDIHSLVLNVRFTGTGLNENENVSENRKSIKFMAKFHKE